MLDRLEFLVSEALVSFRRNGWMTVAAVGTAAVALFLIGGLGHAYVGLRGYADSLANRFTMRAFLRDGAKYEDIHATAQQMRAIPGVADVVWVPKDKAWEKWRREYPEYTAGLENPFPDALRFRVADLDRAREVVARVEALPKVDSQEGVAFLDDERRFLAEGLRFVRWLGFALGGLGLLTAGILIYNAIRLTVLARRREIRVMQLVGASHSTVQVPFLIEGALQGTLGGALAAALLYSAHLGLARITTDYSALGQLGPFPIWTALPALAAAGAVFGAACSALAVRSPMSLGARAH